MEILLYILGGLILVIGIIVAVYILFQIFFKVFMYVISFVVGLIALAIIICGLAVVINLCQKGTIFGNGMSFSEGIHSVMESTHTSSKESPKVSKGDLSVKEIEGAKEVKK